MLTFITIKKTQIQFASCKFRLFLPSALQVNIINCDIDTLAQATTATTTTATKLTILTESKFALEELNASHPNPNLCPLGHDEGKKSNQSLGQSDISTTFKCSTFISTDDSLATLQQSDRHKFIYWRLNHLNHRRSFYNLPTNPAKMPNIRVFSGSSHPALAGQICERLGMSDQIP